MLVSVSARIVVTGDYVLIRTALARLIASEPGMEIAAECANAAEAVAEALATRPDVVVMDLDGERRAESIEHLFTLIRPHPVLVLAANEHAPFLAPALAHGALGVLLKSRPPEVLMRAIRAVVAGEAWIEPLVLAMMVGAAPPPCRTEIVKLTPREHEIVELVALGLKNKKIGERLFIAENTVRHHLTSIFSKLSVSSRLELMRYAYRGETGTIVPGPRD